MSVLALQAGLLTVLASYVAWLLREDLWTALMVALILYLLLFWQFLSQFQSLHDFRKWFGIEPDVDDEKLVTAVSAGLNALANDVYASAKENGYGSYNHRLALHFFYNAVQTCKWFGLRVDEIKESYMDISHVDHYQQLREVPVPRHEELQAKLERF